MSIRKKLGKVLGDNVKDVLRVSLILIVIVVLIVASLQLYSLSKKDSEQLYLFVTAAQRFHNKLEEGTLLDDFDLLADAIDDYTADGTAELDLWVTDSQLLAKSYSDQFSWLYPSMESLDLFESLIDEGQLFSSSFSRLSRAWTAKKQDNINEYQEYMDKARSYFGQALVKREENKVIINDILERLDVNIEQ